MTNNQLSEVKEYIIDTEFVSTAKNKLHFLEIAMLNPETNVISDFHFDIKLNNWEQNYIKRATAGKYGKRTQEVFKSVEKLYSGNFKHERIKNICEINSCDYQYERLNHISLVDELNSPCMLYAWDTSSDKKLITEFEHDLIEFIDVQSIWIRRFGGNQLSLSNAYKHVLFNTNRLDEQNLIDIAHFACVDILMLKEVIDFTKNHDKKLKPIPMLQEARDRQIFENYELIEAWNEKLESLQNHLKIETNEEIINKINSKIKKLEKKIRSKKLANNKLYKQQVYDTPWWTRD